jgi:hypothetical protein
VLSVVLGLSVVSAGAFGQDTERRGRKYKAPPPLCHIEVQVFKKATGKPLMNAAVVFNPTMGGKDLGNLEVKTDPDGKAVVDMIPVGATVSVQVIATGYATYAEEFVIDQSSKEIEISLLRPQEQISAYEDNEGKTSTRKAGVQEPKRPTDAAAPAAKPDSPPPASSSGNSAGSSAGSSSGNSTGSSGDSKSGSSTTPKQ